MEACMYTWGTFSELLSTMDVTSLKPKLQDKIQNGKPWFKARMLHCSCYMYVQIHFILINLYHILLRL